MNKSIVSLILIDGLRHDYINPVDSPFLYSLAEHNIEGIVRETFAFELRPAFFAGLQPEDCDVAHMFYYNPNDSPFRSIYVSHGDRSKISQNLRTDAERRGYSLVKYIGGCAEIPIQLLKYFDFSEKYHTSDPSSIPGHKTLFDYLRSDGKKWLWIGYPEDAGTTKDVSGRFFNELTPDIDFIYLHFSELDWIGHEFGPHSQEQKRILKEIDEAVRKIYIKLNQTFTVVRGMIFGDHGQVEIKKNINIEIMLSKSGLEIEKDYIYFLDSTQARFWFFNDTAKRKVIELLNTIPEGSILSDIDYERLHFRFNHNKFGDVIFVMNDGVGIFPNFFQRIKPCKGLHGYLPEVEGNWAKLIITGCGVNKHLKHTVEMVDIYPTILDLLGYTKPADIEIKSVFERIGVQIEQENYSASVIMPTYNRLETLKKCVSAIENQTYPKDNFELIIVDDGSTDGTINFLEEYIRCSSLKFKYFKQEHGGPSAARNRGIRNARGRIIILVGDDMIMPNDFIDNHMRFHQEWPQLSHACLGFIDWSKDIEINPLMEIITSAEGGQQFCYDYVEKLDRDNVGYKVFWSSNISFKRLFCLTYGLFNDKVFKHAMWEDVELGYRLEKSGLILHYRKDCRIYHEHKITIDRFAERQRLVGWYSHDLAKLGIPVGYNCRGYENDMLYSKNALVDIVNAVQIFEKSCEYSNIPVLNKLYNSALYYAAIVGYKERENNLNDEVGGIVALLYNISLIDEQVRQRDEQVRQRDEQLRQRDEQVRQRDEQLRQRDEQVRQRDEQLRQRDEQVRQMQATISWKITAPLRKIYDIFITKRVVKREKV